MVLVTEHILSRPCRSAFGLGWARDIAGQRKIILLDVILKIRYIKQDSFIIKLHILYYQ